MSTRHDRFVLDFLFALQTKMCKTWSECFNQSTSPVRQSCWGGHAWGEIHNGMFLGRKSLRIPSINWNKYYIIEIILRISVLNVESIRLIQMVGLKVIFPLLLFMEFYATSKFDEILSIFKTITQKVPPINTLQ